jgi:phosphate uptake regulator
MPKPAQVQKMVAKAEEQIARLQEAMLADPPPPPEELAEMEKSINDHLAKIERLQGLTARVDAIKKAK